MHSISALRGRAADAILNYLDGVNDVVEDLTTEEGRQRQLQQAQTNWASTLGQLGLGGFAGASDSASSIAPGSSHNPKTSMPVPQRDGVWMQAPAARIGGSGIGGCDTDGRLIGLEEVSSAHRGQNKEEQLAPDAIHSVPQKGSISPSEIARMGSVEVVEPSEARVHLLKRVDSQDIPRCSPSDCDLTRLSSGSVSSTCAPGSSGSSSSPACHASPSSSVPYQFPVSAPAPRTSSMSSNNGSSYLASYPAELPMDPLSSIGSKESTKHQERLSSIDSTSSKAKGCNDFEWDQDIATECSPDGPLSTDGAEHGVNRRLVTATEVPKFPYGTSVSVEQSCPDHSKASASQAQHLLARLVVCDPMNALCCTCFRSGVTHASTSLAALFCQQCAAEHGKLGSGAGIRHLAAHWTEGEIQELMEGGNSKLWNSPTGNDNPDSQGGYHERLSSGINSEIYNPPGFGEQQFQQQSLKESALAEQPVFLQRVSQFALRDEHLDRAISMYQQDPAIEPSTHQQRTNVTSLPGTTVQHSGCQQLAPAEQSGYQRPPSEPTGKCPRTDSAWLTPEPRSLTGISFGGVTCHSPSSPASSPALGSLPGQQFPRSGTSIAEPSMDSWIATMMRR